ncbi:unnamed protein product [marine sediment metagenome]|uniref:Uncharacterized protein n=1 Tax=marine sediment metagenome TaxID=412755 RepID=X1L7V9_9ZZZZ
MEVRDYFKTILDTKTGHRSREEIAGDLTYSAAYPENTQRLILEILLDIRDQLDQNQ